MAFDGINVSYAGLEGGAEGISGVARNLEERLASLQASLRAVGAGWDGEAHTAFHSNMTVLGQTLDALREIQQRTGTTVATSRIDYQAIDRRNASRILEA
jgi:WXG100 family type VII secretion target